MKVLVVYESDGNGGAARSACRIIKGLQATGVQSQMLVQARESDDISVLGPGSKINKE